MGNSLEVRVPFADHKLIEFVLQLPFNILFDIKNPKRFLKDIMKNDLPDYILNMPKKGFTPPLNYINEIVETYKPNFFKTKLYHYNQVVVDKIISKHYMNHE